MNADQLQGTWKQYRGKVRKPQERFVEDSSNSEIRARSTRLRLESLLTDLDLCATFISLFRTRIEIGNKESAKRSLENAHEAFDAVTGLSQDFGFEERHRIEQRLKDVKTQLDEAHTLLRE